MTTQPATIDYRSGDGWRPRGVVIEVNRNHPAGNRVKAHLPENWRTVTRYVSEDGAIHALAVGHLYAREAITFDVEESLGLMCRAYDRGGIEAVRAAIGGGMFSLILVDCRAQRLYALSDLLACMPLFYRRHGDGITIASHQLDFADAEPFSREACREYLAFGYLPFSPSLLENAHRLGPGQVLTVDLANPQEAEVSAEQFPAYPPPEDRIADPREACERLDALFSRYFDRLGDAPFTAGVSGGYDSRLIAAYTADKQSRFVTFDNPQTDEAVVAQCITAALGTTTEIGRIPGDAPSRFIADFYGGMQTLDSLEMSHVFGSLNLLDQGEPRYLIDGFLGGEAMGCHYFYKLAGGLEPLGRVLLGLDRYRGAPGADADYAERLATLYGRRLSGAQLADLGIPPAVFADRIAAMAAEQRECCPTDADMQELLSYRLRTRRVIACGPVTFLRRRFTLCPFYDVDVFTTCLSVAKSLRAGDRLYNAFWRYRFPELVRIPKESTGGKARQGAIAYRMTHFRNVLLRRVKQRLPARLRRGGKAGGDVGDFQTMFRHEPANRAMFDAALEHASPRFAEMGLPDPVACANATEDNTLYLRLVSLATLVSDHADTGFISFE